MSSGEESQSKKRKLEEKEEKETQGDLKSVGSVDVEVENSQIGGEQIEQETNMADQRDLVLPNVSPLTQLPDELLLAVLSKLFVDHLSFPHSHNQLLHPIASSSRRLRELFFSESLWRRVFISQGDSPDAPTIRFNSDVFAILSRMANAIHNLQLHVKGNFGRYRSLFPQFPHFANVRKLVLNVGCQTPMELDLITQRCPSVTSLELTGVYLDDRLLNTIASRCPNLVEIRFSECCVESSIYPPVQFVTVFNHLQAVDIDFYDVTDSHIDQIARLFNRSLRSISFSSQIKLSGSAVRSIVQNCPLIEEISIENATDLSDLKFLSNLKRLYISFPSRVRCVGLSECFSRPFSQLRHLEVFDYNSNTNISDSQLEQIASSCPSLEYLRLDINWGQLCGYIRDSDVSDAGVIEIVNKCRNLRELQGRFLLVTERSFIGAAQKLPNLKRLVLAANNLDENVLINEFANTKGLEIFVNSREILRT